MNVIWTIIIGFVPRGRAIYARRVSDGRVRLVSSFGRKVVKELPNGRRVKVLMRECYRKYGGLLRIAAGSYCQ